ncbi:MAG: bifunctional 5,10-methylenetetrahydrofolate dehydrogenase/5,10-methenyltetrahydrofolate cyclohydrolase [Candidatus Bathyarchaeota archaeon]|nr:bifunctional 5,10-methylenetetrahydrofolate dehydrogenase/5,10-methenyltetrahydrofolate cyclohydrolase [Candidatus Bathyarchaeota archaeon]
MAIVLDGKATTEKVMEEITAEVEKLAAKDIIPGLALVLTGTDKYSARYVKLKKRRAEKIGMYAEFHHLEETTDEELVALVHKLNADPKIHGIMVQLPLTEGLDELKVVNAIDPAKDVDGLSPNTLGKVLMGEDCYLPAGVEAIMELFKRYDIDPNKKHWVVVGSSNFLTKPLAAYLMNLSSNVTQVDEGCPHIAKRVKMADVISTEIFKKNFITADMVKEGVIIVDNGNNYEGKKVFGDVDPGVYEKASAYTPVPGGTGPMLIAMLLRNTVKAASK